MVEDRLPNRRREDPRLEEILKVITAMQATVGSLEGRMTRLERTLFDIRKDVEDFHIGDMSKDQKTALLPMLDDYDRRREAIEVGRTRTEGWARWSTIFSGLSAFVLTCFAIITFVQTIRGK